MSNVADRLEIVEVIEAWAIARDTGDWERLRSCVHPEATMTATWFHGGFTQFIEESGASFARGARSMHELGGTMATVVGTRAIAQTRLTLRARGEVEGVLVDVACYGRFYDFFEKRDGVWRIAERRCVYEKDRMDPVVPGGPVPKLDPALLESFPEGYRHLAYMQTKRGSTVARGLPGAKGEALDALYARGRAWLERK